MALPRAGAGLRLQHRRNSTPTGGGEGGEGGAKLKQKRAATKGTLDEQMKDALQPIRNEINAEAATLAAETGDPSPSSGSPELHWSPHGSRRLHRRGWPTDPGPPKTTLYTKVSTSDQPSPTGLETPAGTFSTWVG